MPRSKPSDCTELRITLGTKERQLLDQIAGSYSFNKVATPTVSLMSDATGLAVFAGILAIFYPKINNYLNIPDFDPIEAMKEGVKDTIREQEQEAIEGKKSFAQQQNEFVLDGLNRAFGFFRERVY